MLTCTSLTSRLEQYWCWCWGSVEYWGCEWGADRECGYRHWAWKRPQGQCAEFNVVQLYPLIASTVLIFDQLALSLPRNRFWNFSIFVRNYRTRQFAVFSRLKYTDKGEFQYCLSIVMELILCVLVLWHKCWRLYINHRFGLRKTNLSKRVCLVFRASGLG